MVRHRKSFRAQSRHRLGALSVATVLIVAGCGGEDEAAPGDTVTMNVVESAAPTDSTPVATDPGTDPPAAGAQSDTATTQTPTATDPPASTAPPTPLPPVADLAGVQVGFELAVEVDKPTGVAWRNGDPAMYVTTQPGPIYRVLDGTLSTVLDLTSDTFPDALGSERGILGIAFDPRDGRMFVNYTDRNDDTRVVSYELLDGVAVPESRREVLFIDQPGIGHNGGRLWFDDQGYLYIGSGDGGGSNGRDAADTTKLLGAILRIEPRLAGEGYLIPPDNPFADGVDDRPEVLARGFRNPWTFSVDVPTGDIWVGDVGNDTMEEISLLSPDRWGANFGWPYFEGTTPRLPDEAPAGLIEPVHAYDRSLGVAVMGGYVYRGQQIPDLNGAYLFSDLGGPVWAIGSDGVVRIDADTIRTVTGWAQRPDGELYLLGFEGIFDLVQR